MMQNLQSIFTKLIKGFADNLKHDNYMFVCYFLKNDTIFIL